MTTKITSVSDALVALAASKFTGYTKLPNPYYAPDNNELFLNKGFGVAVGSGQRTDRFISSQFSWQRDYSIVMTGLVTATDHNTGQREALVKGLLEDSFKLIKALEQEPTLGGLAIKAEYRSDSGISYLEGKTGRFFLLELDVIVEYIEDLS